MEKGPNKTKPGERRYELDWLRVLAVLFLIFFHSARPFDFGSFYVKNGNLSTAMQAFTGSVDIWFMPLFFLIAGGAACYSLRSRRPGEFAKERVKRLLVPLLFGTFILIPPQVYCVFVKARHPGFSNSYLSYYRYLFSVPYLTKITGGTVGPARIEAQTLEPAQLWFILYLLVFSLVALPLFLSIKKGKAGRLVSGFAGFCERPGAIFLLAIPIIICNAGLELDTSIYRLFHIVPFILGYLMYSDERFGPAIDRHGRVALVLAAVISTAYIFVFWIAKVEYKGWITVAWPIARGLDTWLWLIAFLALGRRFLNFSNRTLTYANEASYPFYILHQTVIVLFAFEIVELGTSVGLKYLLLTTVSLAVTLAAYDILVKRTGPTRFLFGMKPRPKNPAVQQ